MLLAANKAKDSLLFNYIELIQEEVYKCEYQLHKIKESDLIAAMWAKSSPSVLDFTN